MFNTWYAFSTLKCCRRLILDGVDLILGVAPADEMETSRCDGELSAICDGDILFERDHVIVCDIFKGMYMHR